MMVNRLPSPGLLSTVRRPPIADTRLLASNAPTPNPPFLVDANGWNSRSAHLHDVKMSAKFPVGVLVVAAVGWQLYSVVNEVGDDAL